MNKGDLVNAIAENAGLSKADAANALNATLDAVTNTLSSGEKVTLVGFGTFSLSYRAARTGRNPRQPTQAIDIPAKVVAKFKPGKELGDAVNTDDLKAKMA
jgi:DNA-binding protein HU-beta